MDRDTLFLWLAGILAAVLLVIVIAAYWHAYSTCDGAVVKNAFDWPVCVASGGKR